MRIIGGRFRGHRLTPAPKRGVRPTADPVREALFNILGEDVEGAPFLDLCAGTGAVGFEALSRGASPVVLVERDRAALAVIAKNVERLGLEAAPELRVVRAELGAWLRGPGPAELGPAGVIFLDPPYEERRQRTWLAALAEGPLVGEDTLLVLEHRTGRDPELPGLALAWSKSYGDSTLRAMSRP